MRTLLLLSALMAWTHTRRSRQMHENVNAVLKVANVPRKAVPMDAAALSRALNCEDDTQLSLSKLASIEDEQQWLRFWRWFVRIVGLEVGLVTFDAEEVLAQVKPKMLKAALADEQREKVGA